MFYYLRKYPFSLISVVVIFCLSIIKTPNTEMEGIPHLDKLAHFGMYFALTCILWIEFICVHRKQPAPLWHAWIGGLICPIVFGGIMELTQAIFTTYRSCDIFDFLSNTLGSILAAFGMYWMIYRRYIYK